MSRPIRFLATSPFVFAFLLGFPDLSVVTHAGEWGHWRGNGNGVSEDAAPPVAWDETTHLKWKIEIPGAGSGSPVVWGDQVFVVSGVPVAGGRRGTLDFTLFCFERNTGALRWKSVAVTAAPHEPTHSTNNFAPASPCTDGQHVYAHFGSRGLYCFTMAGEKVWSRVDFGKMRARNQFGEGSSPTLSGDRILVPWDHEGPSALYSLDKLTGKTVWKAERDEPTCWATPRVIEVQGKKQVVMNGQTCARSYDFETGKELWRCGGQTERPVASAVASEDLIFVGSGFRGSFLAAFRPDGTGDIEGTEHVVWSVDRDTPDIASPLLSGDRLYFFKAKLGILSCFDARTGDPYYTSVRVPGLNGMIYSSPIAANGNVYLTDRNGTTVVIRDTEKFEVVSVNRVGETVDATLAPVDRELFVRGEKHLFCFSSDLAK
ncbi:MAG: PQQ-binding-like beta-propeller repeat protein [Rubripirellula sp.]